MHKLLICVIELPAPRRIAMPNSSMAGSELENVIQTQPDMEIKEPAQ